MSKLDFNGSNLVKSYRLNREEDDGPRIIDSNSLIEEKLERLRVLMPELGMTSFEGESSEGSGEFIGGLDADMLDALVSEDYEAQYDEEGNPVSNVIKAAPPEPVYQEPVYEGPSPEELIADAQAQIEQMMQNAQADIEAAKAQGYEEGRSQGYSDGQAQAQAEIQDAYEAVERERMALENQYQEIIDDIEPQLVGTLAKIYEQVLGVELADQQGIVVSLLNTALGRIDSCKNYMIHVSHDDHEYVLEHRDELVTASMPEDVTIDIVEDAMMRPGDCMIETANGVYDCSLGVQLANIRKKLELLSYQ